MQFNILDHYNQKNYFFWIDQDIVADVYIIMPAQAR